MADRIDIALAEELVGESPCMHRLREQVVAVADSRVNLLLEGESGTGKELVSRMVHRLSPRAAGPFIGVNCAAVHETLLESELFGHEAGAFTGAEQATVGFLRAADGGTILLDEIGDMSNSLQSKLLRVLEGREVVPVGSTRAIPIDVRVIAATHRDLGRAVREGSFRRDLYYRVNVVCLLIPPLRQRRGDIPMLAEHLLQKTAEILDVPVRKVSPAAMAVLMRHDWPGNVRELDNVIQRAYVFGRGPVIGTEDLPEEICDPSQPAGAAFPTLQQAMGKHVQAALQMSDGARSRAAKLLGVDRTTLWRMLSRQNLHK